MQRAGVPVTAHTSLQVDSVFTALRVLSNAIIKMGNPRAYKLATDDQNRPYKAWLKTQPTILTNTWGGQWQYDGQARTVVSLALFGEAFWYTLTRDYLGFPSAPWRSPRRTTCGSANSTWPRCPVGTTSTPRSHPTSHREQPVQR